MIHIKKKKRNSDSCVASDLVNKNLLYNRIYKFMDPLKCVKIGPNGHLYLDALSSSCFPTPLPRQTSFSDIPRSWLMKSPFTPVQKLNVFFRFYCPPPPIISYPIRFTST